MEWDRSIIYWNYKGNLLSKTSFVKKFRASNLKLNKNFKIFHKIQNISLQSSCFFQDVSKACLFQKRVKKQKMSLQSLMRNFKGFCKKKKRKSIKNQNKSDIKRTKTLPNFKSPSKKSLVEFFSITNFQYMEVKKLSVFFRKYRIYNKKKIQRNVILFKILIKNLFLIKKLNKKEKTTYSRNKNRIKLGFKKSLGIENTFSKLFHLLFHEKKILNKTRAIFKISDNEMSVHLEQISSTKLYLRLKCISNFFLKFVKKIFAKRSEIFSVNKIIILETVLSKSSTRKNSINEYGCELTKKLAIFT